MACEPALVGPGYIPAVAGSSRWCGWSVEEQDFEPADEGRGAGSKEWRVVREYAASSQVVRYESR